MIQTHWPVKNLNRPITCKEIVPVIKNLQTNKNQQSHGFSTEFYQKFKEELIPIRLKLHHTIETEHCQTLCETIITQILKLHKDSKKKKNYRKISLIDTKIIKYCQTKFQEHIKNHPP